MYWRIPPRYNILTRISLVNKQALFVKLIFFICSFLFLSLIWFQLGDSGSIHKNNESSVQEVIKNVARDFRYAEVYRKTSRLPKDIKYILLWTPQDFAPFYYFEHGQQAFINNNCSVINCYVTTDRQFFGRDITKFDAIAFNGRNVDHMRKWILPRNRSVTQKYIFFNMESSDNYPICDKHFNGLFNWTSTYKLDSDIPFPYLQIRNSDGEVVGPKIDMEWEEDMVDIDEDLADKLQNKSKAAAWFVSNCKARSNREQFVEKLRKVLSSKGFDVDVYGSCGKFKCPKERKADCDILLERDYFFYLSLENSFAEDYVTEKLTSALQHYTVPIVFGGANYSRFLPPGSYLDGGKLEVKELANKMVELMLSSKLYGRYFRWRNYYSYHDPLSDNICSVCAALHNEKMVKTSTNYRQFRKWWNPNFKERCHLNTPKNYKRKKSVKK